RRRRSSQPPARGPRGQPRAARVRVRRVDQAPGGRLAQRLGRIAEIGEQHELGGAARPAHLDRARADLERRCAAAADPGDERHDLAPAQLEQPPHGREEGSVRFAREARPVELRALEGPRVAGIGSAAAGSRNFSKPANSRLRPSVTARARSPEKSQKNRNGVAAANSSPMKSIGGEGASSNTVIATSSAASEASREMRSPSARLPTWSWFWMNDTNAV